MNSTRKLDRLKDWLRRNARRLRKPGPSGQSPPKSSGTYGGLREGVLSQRTAPAAEENADELATECTKASLPPSSIGQGAFGSERSSSPHRSSKINNVVLERRSSGDPTTITGATVICPPASREGTGIEAAPLMEVSSTTPPSPEQPAAESCGNNTQARKPGHQKTPSSDESIPEYSGDTASGATAKLDSIECEVEISPGRWTKGKFMIDTGVDRSFLTQSFVAKHKIPVYPVKDVGRIGSFKSPLVPGVATINKFAHNVRLGSEQLKLEPFKAQLLVPDGNEHEELAGVVGRGLIERKGIMHLAIQWINEEDKKPRLAGPGVAVDNRDKATKVKDKNAWGPNQSWMGGELDQFEAELEKPATASTSHGGGNSDFSHNSNKQTSVTTKDMGDEASKT